MTKQKQPGKFLICTTVYLGKGIQQLLINGYVVAEAATEIDLFREAKKIGIDLSKLKPEKAVGDNDRFFVQWMGDLSTYDYLRWKGTIGHGAILKHAAQLIKDQKEAVS